MRQSLSWLAILLGIPSGFVVAIRLGYFRFGGSVPAEIETLFPFAAVLLSLAILWLATRVLARARTTPVRGRARRNSESDYEAFKRDRAALIERLAADPELASYADRMRAGENWNEVQIAYDRDPATPTTCAHLAEIERAIRRAGVPVKLQHAGVVWADCVVDEPALRAAHTIEAPATYGLRPQYDRSAEDPPSAEFRCAEHGSVIFVVEASQAKPGTMTFPADGTAGA